MTRGSGSRESRPSRRPTPSSAGLPAGAQRSLRRRSGRRGLGLHADPGRRSRRDPVRRGGTPGRRRQLRLLPDAETADPRKPDAAPFRQRRGSRCTSIPTARMPSSMGLGASDATTATERSRTATMKNAPLKSARRRGLWKCGQGIRLAHSPTAEQNQKKRTDHALPKPDKFIRYRQILPPEVFPFGCRNPKSSSSRSRRWLGAEPGVQRAGRRFDPDLKAQPSSRGRGSGGS